MATLITWAANSHAIPQLYCSLDHEFMAHLESYGCSLFRLLKLPTSYTHTLGPLVDILLSHYDSTQHVFIFGCHRLRITLEDVLFITGLPISGKPVIVSSNTYDTAAFQWLFGPGSNGSSLTVLESYATNKGFDTHKRMIAVLLYVISCFITPTSQIKATCVEFVKNFVEVDAYAWGAALLAFLYRGIEKWKDDQSCGKTKLTIDGNVWLLLCFFFIRIPKLMPAVGVELDMVVEKVRIVSKNLKSNYKKDVVHILNNLADEDIRWLPYDSSWLPPRLQDQYRFRALVAPLFCNNYVVHHRPQLVPKQFGLTEGSVAGFERYDYEIKIKHSKGPNDYLTLYKKEIQLWEEGKQLQDFLSRKRSADVVEASSPSTKKSKLDVLHEEIARELMEKLGSVTRLSKEENEQKIRLLELKIKNSEAREEKLNSEVEKLMSDVRVAREMNVKLEGEIKSSEAREKKLNSEVEKLISEVRVAREMNVKLEGEIKNSEAREKKFNSEVEKLMSEVRVAREMNVKLEGEIKSSEGLEKKLMSEVRAAVERNAKLEGGIKHAISSLANLVKKSQDDDSTVHEAKGDLGKDSAGKTELKSKSVGKESHAKDSTSGKSSKISSSSISKKEAEPKRKAKKGNEEATTKGTSSSKPSEREQGKGKSVTAVAEKQPSREEMQSVVADILKRVDSDTVTMSHILKQLGKHFGVQVKHRQAEVRELVTQVIESMYHDEEAEFGDESE